MGNSNSNNNNSNNNNSNNKYGWKRDYHDTRDHKYECKECDNTQYFDHRSKCPEVYDQGNLGSCTANAIGFAYEFDEIIQKETNVFEPSRLFIYYNERAMEDTVNTDSGASIRDGIKSINKIGVCSEDMWKYDISQFTVKPTEECYKAAENHKSVKYSRVNQDKESIISALSEGYVVPFGFKVYESFENGTVKDDGIMSMPSEDERCLGGHAVAIVGNIKIKDTEYFIVRNSWSKEWGDNGYFYMPYEFACNSNYCSDLWVVKSVKDI